MANMPTAKACACHPTPPPSLPCRLALMGLGQKYGSAVYQLLIKDYVPETTSAAGDWSEVTFENTLDMSTATIRKRIRG